MNPLAYIAVRLVILLLVNSICYYLFTRFSGFVSLAAKVKAAQRKFGMRLAAVELLLVIAEVVLVLTVLDVPSPWASILGVYFIGLPATLLPLAFVARGRKLYRDRYQSLEKKIEKDTEEVETNFNLITARLSDPSWLQSRCLQLEAASRTAPPHAKRRFKALYDRLLSVERSAPAELLIAQARLALQKGNGQKALDHLLTWTRRWKQARDVADDVINKYEQLMATTGMEEVSADRFLPLLDLASLHPEDARAGVWLRARQLLNEGEVRGALSAALHNIHNWRSDWQARMDQHALDIVLLSMEINSYTQTLEFLDRIHNPVLRVEVQQMIAERASAGSEISRTAFYSLENTGIVGRRRAAFIKFKIGSEQQCQEARKMLREDVEAREWLTPSSFMVSGG